MKITDEWLYEQMPKAEKAILDEVPDQPELPFEPSEKFERRMKRLIRQSRHPKMYFRHMNRAGRVAAMFVVGIMIIGAMTLGTKATEPLRIEIKEQIWHEGSVEEYYSVTGEGRIKYLTYVPDGYEKLYEEEIEGSYGTEYENIFGKKIGYSVWILSDGSGTLRDTEFERVEYVEMRGTTIEIGYKDTGWVNCYWIEDNAIYLLDTQDVDKEELLKMISSIE